LAAPLREQASRQNLPTSEAATGDNTLTDLANAKRNGATRRAILGGAVSAAALISAAPLALAQEVRDEIPMDELMADTGLDDIVVGNADAKVTIIEYASMTCGHCANFHNNVYPELKEKYIDTGKVRFIKREFPLDNLAFAASLLSRCAGDGGNDAKSAAFTGVLFKRRSDWIVRGNPVPRLFDLAKQAGFTQESFNACLTNQDLQQKIAASREKASKEFGVNSTPTFFINGKRLKGRSDQFASFAAAIDPLLGES
jgi:protein-disulfide isomerase